MIACADRERSILHNVVLSLLNQEHNDTSVHGNYVIIVQATLGFLRLLEETHRILAWSCCQQSTTLTLEFTQVLMNISIYIASNIVWTRELVAQTHVSKMSTLKGKAA